MVTKEFDRYDLVSFLYLQKFKNVGFSIRNKRVYFQFEGTPELEEAVRSYSNNEARVDPLAFNQQVKSTIHLSNDILKGVHDNGK
jgi:hypothetical protein